MRIIGIGNALVDIMTVLKDEDILERFKLPRGSMTLIDLELSNRMNDETSGLHKTMASGGSSANTIHGLANLGEETVFVGKTGKDELGEFFQRDMEESGIRPVLAQSFTHTGRVMAFISPDSERTMATHLGASVELGPEDITSGLYEKADYVYVEGYLINNRELFSKAIRLGREAGLKVCVDLASYNIVEQYRTELLDDLQNYVDIAFANEEEAKALTGLSPEKALDEIAEMCDTAVVKIGSRGSLVKRAGESVHVEAEKAKSIDTTGAGDSYAAGFIYGDAHELGLEKSARIGNLIASRVIGVMGPRLSREVWDALLPKIHLIEKD